MKMFSLFACVLFSCCVFVLVGHRSQGNKMAASSFQWKLLFQLKHQSFLNGNGCIYNSPSHAHTHTPMAVSYQQSAAQIIRTNLGFSVLPKDTLTCGGGGSDRTTNPVISGTALPAESAAPLSLHGLMSECVIQCTHSAVCVFSVCVFSVCVLTDSWSSSSVGGFWSQHPEQTKQQLAVRLYLALLDSIALYWSPLDSTGLLFTERDWILLLYDALSWTF